MFTPGMDMQNYSQSSNLHGVTRTVTNIQKELQHTYYFKHTAEHTKYASHKYQPSDVTSQGSI